MKVKGQGHTEVRKVFDRSSHGDTLMNQIWYDFVKGRKDVARTNIWQKPYKIDFEVKGQHGIGLISVCDTPPHGHTPMFQI